MNSLKVIISENSILRIDGDYREAIISCEAGTVNVTQQNDSEDHILSKDNNFCINKEGPVIAWALSDAHLELRFPNRTGYGVTERVKRLFDMLKITKREGF